MQEPSAYCTQDRSIHGMIHGSISHQRGGTKGKRKGLIRAHSSVDTLQYLFRFVFCDEALHTPHSHTVICVVHVR